MKVAGLTEHLGDRVLLKLGALELLHDGAVRACNLEFHGPATRSSLGWTEGRPTPLLGPAVHLRDQPLGDSSGCSTWHRVFLLRAGTQVRRDVHALFC